MTRRRRREWRGVVRDGWGKRRLFRDCARGATNLAAHTVAHGANRRRHGNWPYGPTIGRTATARRDAMRSGGHFFVVAGADPVSVLAMRRLAFDTQKKPEGASAAVVCVSRRIAPHASATAQTTLDKAKIGH